MEGMGCVKEKTTLLNETIDIVSRIENAANTADIVHRKLFGFCYQDSIVDKKSSEPPSQVPEGLAGDIQIMKRNLSTLESILDMIVQNL